MIFFHALIFRQWNFYITYFYSYVIMYPFLHNDIFLLLTLILISSCIDFYTLKLLYYLHLYLCPHLLPFTHWHFSNTYTNGYFIVYCVLQIDIFLLLTLTFLSACTVFYSLGFFYCLHLHIFYHVLIFRLCVIYITYTYNCFIMY